MKNSKVVSLLKKCSFSELKQLNKFVQSPYFNTNTSIVAFYQYLRKNAPDFNEKRINKQRIFKYLFPKQNYSDKRLLNLMSDLVKLIELFWQIENLKNQTIQQHIELARAYEQHQFNNYWQQNINHAEKMIQTEALEAADYYQYQLQLELERHDVIESEEQRNQEPNLQAVHHHLDTYYLCNKLKYYCKVLNYQGFKNHTYDIRMIDLVLIEASRPTYEQEVAIQIYYHGVRTLLSIEHEGSFEALKILLSTYCHHFALSEMQNMFVLARNFCIKKMNKGKGAYYAKELLKIYQIEIKESVILVNNVLPTATCRNIVVTATLCNELTWAAHFLVQFKPHIDTEAFSFNMAFVHFYQQKYKAAFTLLSQTHFKEVLMLLAAKGLLLKTYYELYLNYEDDFDYEDQLDLYLQSFSIFLKRKQEVLTKRYIYYSNMVAMVKQLFNITKDLRLEEKKLLALQSKLQTTVEVAEKRWLRKKITELQAKL